MASEKRRFPKKPDFVTGVGRIEKQTRHPLCRAPFFPFAAIPDFFTSC
jgi:hypothetical protein